MSHRVILGAFDGTFVLRVSRPGYDVLDPSLSPEFLAFDSRWNGTGKIWSQGIATNFVGSNGDSYIEIPLGYTPTPTTMPAVLAHLRWNGVGFLDANFMNGFSKIGLGPGIIGSTMKFYISGANPSALSGVHYVVMRAFE